MCSQQEQDAVFWFLIFKLEVIAALQTDAEKRDSELRYRENEINNAHIASALERDSLTNSYERKLKEVHGVLNEKEAAYKVMQSEFSVIKDFRVFNSTNAARKKDMNYSETSTPKNRKSQIPRSDIEISLERWSASFLKKRLGCKRTRTER